MTDRGGRRPAHAPRAGRVRRSAPGLPALLVALLVAWAGAGPPAAAQEPPDPMQAERDLAAARAELEEVVGRRLLGLEAPPLPDVPRQDLEEADRELVTRLADTPPGEWEPGDRTRLAVLLAREASTLAAAGTEGEAVAPEDLAPRALPLLKVSRLLALRDRVALLEGREAAFADGLEARADLGLRLMLQPILLGPLFGTAFHTRIVEDVRTATERRETSAGTLERLDGLLHRWQLGAPDPAAVLARDTLFTLECAEAAIADQEVAVYDGIGAALSAPWLQDVAQLARDCRREGCRRAAEAVEAARRSDEDPYRVIADLMMPNLFHALMKLTGGEELGRLARTAVALRLEALEQGSYPPDLTRIAPEAGLSPGQEEELGYERLPDGGARLRLTTEEVVTDQAEQNRPRYRRLLTWDLPPVPSPEGRNATGSIARPTRAAGALAGVRRR